MQKKKGLPSILEKLGIPNRALDWKMIVRDLEMIEKQHPEAMQEVLDYISQNNMFFSTGNEIAPLNIELLSSLWGNQFNFMVINDSQPAQVINESYPTSFPITQGNLIPSSLISATESIQRPGDVRPTYGSIGGRCCIPPSLDI
jgi:hypothetical protein